MTGANKGLILVPIGFRITGHLALCEFLLTLKSNSGGFIFSAGCKGKGAVWGGLVELVSYLPFGTGPNTTRAPQFPLLCAFFSFLKCASC